MIFRWRRVSFLLQLVNVKMDRKEGGWWFKGRKAGQGRIGLPGELITGVFGISNELTPKRINIHGLNEVA